MIIIYVLEGCPFCSKAIQMLNNHKIKYEKIVVPNKDDIKTVYKKKMNMKSFPMIFIEVGQNTFSKIGGSSDLELYLQKCVELSTSELKIDNIYALYKAIYSNK